MNPRLLHDELTIAAKAWPDEVAFITPKKEISFGELKEKQSGLAGALQGLGLERGARLAILGHNSADYIAWHYAAAEAGLIFHVLNTRLVMSELKWMIDNAESAALVADPDFSPLAQELMAACASLGFLVGMEGEEGLDYETEALVARGDEPRPPGIDPKDAALMIYTSGTTGRPKGALQSHAGSLIADGLTRDTVDITREDTYLALMPFFHQAGLIRTRATLLAGGRTVIAGKVEAAATAKAMVDYGVTFTMLAAPQQNAAIREKIEHEGVEGFRNLRMILGGGGVGQRATRTIQRTCEALDCQYFGVYGQTETTGPAVYITGQDVFDRPASCGRPLPGVKVEIWDPEGRRQRAESVGEIMVSGPITASYWRNDQANQALYSGAWIHTGDLGYLDEDGFLYIKGRVKELIKTGAENVYPREVEAVLEEHPAVSDVAIFGLPDDRWGEVVVAALVCRGGEPPSLEEFKEFCRGKIGAYKIPKALLFVEEIPRNHTGKILRGALSRQALERRGKKSEIEP